MRNTPTGMRDRHLVGWDGSNPEKPLALYSAVGVVFPCTKKTEQPYSNPSIEPSILPRDLNLAGGADAGSFTSEQQYPAPVE